MCMEREKVLGDPLGCVVVGSDVCETFGCRVGR
jgi:hypothetical protein